jgi:hypothetical protein
MKKMSDASAKTFRDLNGRVDIEADEVDDYVALQSGDEIAKAALLLEHSPICRDPSGRIPSGKPVVGPAMRPRENQNLVPRLHQHRNEPRADVTGPANYNGAQSSLIRCIPVP